MIGRVIFDKTEHGSKKSLFYDLTTKKLSLKISEQEEDRPKITIGGEYLAFHFSADEKSDLLDNWLNWNRLVEVGQLGRKEISITILMNRNNLTYSSKQYLYKYSRIIQWFRKFSTTVYNSVWSFRIRITIVHLPYWCSFRALARTLLRKYPRLFN